MGEEEKQPDPIKMVQVLQNAATGLYLSLDHEGTLTATSAPGYLDGKFVGLEAHAFAYRKYVAPQEETVQFGDWRGLPNPIGTVTDSVEKWVEFVEECKALSEEAAKLYPTVPNYKATHPSAVSGPGTAIVSFSAPAPGAATVQQLTCVSPCVSVDSGNAIGPIRYDSTAAGCVIGGTSGEVLWNEGSAARGTQSNQLCAVG